MGVPPEVLAAFGVVPRRAGVGAAAGRAPGDHITVGRLPGGQGGTWRAGDLVLKPTGLVEETVWRAEVLTAMADTADFRIARPVPTRDGGWVAHGWEAWRWTRGEPDPGRHDEILHAGAAFHSALAGLPRPAFLDVRADPWTYGDRVAWAELPVEGDLEWRALLAPLARARRPVHLPAQPVHGDLAGNVLFAPGLPPAIIDWPVYFRPAGWALAVAVIDLLVWYAAPPSLVDRWSSVAGWKQLLIRALIYRMATNEGSRRMGRPVRERAARYAPVVELVLGRGPVDNAGGPRGLSP